MLWFGLQPIMGRLILDILTLAMLLSCPFKATSSMHMMELVLSCVVTMVTAGLTARWTISFPMIPIVLLQSIRYCFDPTKAPLTAKIIKVISVALAVKSLMLTLLFPATELVPINGKYNVGVADLHLPVEGFERSHVTARILYPTEDEVDRIPYLNVETNSEICKEMMGVAPEALQKLDFLLNHLKLSKISASRNGAPLDISLQKDDHRSGKEAGKGSLTEKLPMAIFSHGLTGNHAQYSFQTMSLAASGTVVLSIDHTDGSAIGMKPHDGPFIPFDRTIGNFERDGKKVDHIRGRRGQTDYRARELLAATKAFKKLNEKNIDELEMLGVSFVSKLNVDDVTVLGHSFGAATALTAAARETSWFTSCIAHDPATDWMPDDARRQFFAEDRFIGSDMKYTGGYAGYETEDITEEDNDSQDSKLGIHSLDILFLYSHDFAKRNWGLYSYVVDLHRRSQIGPNNGLSDVSYIYNSYHSDFADINMKLPLWITRFIKMTGPRNPAETAEEIAFRTLDFIERVRQRRHSKTKEE